LPNAPEYRISVLRTNNSVLEASPKEVDPSRDSMSLFITLLEEKQPMEEKWGMPPVKEMQPLEEKRKRLPMEEKRGEATCEHDTAYETETGGAVQKWESAQREEGAGAGGKCIYRTTEI
jgi:hypothetical protein